MTGAERIAAERRRQVDLEGFDAAHDEKHSVDDLKRAAMCYTIAEGPDDPMPLEWPWGVQWWKPKDRARNLERAGALYLAAADATTARKDPLGIWSIEATVLRGHAADCGRLIDRLLMLSDRHNRTPDRGGPG